MTAAEGPGTFVPGLFLGQAPRAGGDFACARGAWILGAQYSYREDAFAVSKTSIDGKVERQQQRAVMTVDHVRGTGINLDAEPGRAWRDFDPEIEDTSGTTDRPRRSVLAFRRCGTSPAFRGC